MTNKYIVKIYTIENPDGIELTTYASHILDIDINKMWDRAKKSNNILWGDSLVGVCIKEQEIEDN